METPDRSTSCGSFINLMTQSVEDVFPAERGNDNLWFPKLVRRIQNTKLSR